MAIPLKKIPRSINMGYERKAITEKEGQLSAGTTEFGWNNIRQGGIVSGVYVLNVISQGQQTTRKIIVL